MDAWAHHANYIEKNRPRVGLRHFRFFFSFLLFSRWLKDVRAQNFPRTDFFETLTAGRK